MSSSIFDVVEGMLRGLCSVETPDQAKSKKTLTMALKNDLRALISELENKVVIFFCFLCAQTKSTLYFFDLFSRYFRDSHYVVCIKPHKTDAFFDDDFIKSQLKTSSIVPYMNLMQNGFPNRIPYTEILPKFEELFVKEIEADKLKFCERVLIANGNEKCDFKLGENAVFFRNNKYAGINLELEKLEVITEKVKLKSTDY